MNERQQRDLLDAARAYVKAKISREVSSRAYALKDLELRSCERNLSDAIREVPDSIDALEVDQVVVTVDYTDDGPKFGMITPIKLREAL